MTLLTNSGNDPPVLGAMRSCSLVERPIMKRSFFLSSVSTWSDAYCPRWLNNLEKSCTDRHEVLAFLSHHACWNVVGAESAAELGPQHLVVCGVSGGIVGPPQAGVAMQLLCGEEGLLHHRVLQEPKLGLDHPKPVIGLERLSCLGEERQVSGYKVAVGSQS
jgi:hypothetical protein